MYYCGFNAIQGLEDDVKSHTEDFHTFPVKDVDHLAFSWSYVLAKTKGSEVYVYGFNGDKFDSANLGLKDGVPKGDSTNQLHIGKGTIVSASCCPFRQRALFATSTGECFEWTADETKRVANFLVAESCDAKREDKIVKVSCGFATSLALTSSGQVYSIPSPLILPGIKAVDIASGFEHNLLITSTGDIYSWGIGIRGALGHGALEDDELPARLRDLPRAAGIAAGGWHSVAVTVAGELYAWGWNSHGQLGFPQASVNVTAQPMPVALPRGRRAKVAACGNRHTVVLMDDNSVWGCGWNEYGQLGRGKDSWELRKLCVPPGNISRVLAGGWNTAVLLEQTT